MNSFTRTRAAMSAGVESSTKSGHVRRVPLADQAAAALDRMSQREHFTTPRDLVFCNVLGRPLDDSAYAAATVAPRLRPMSVRCASTTSATLSARYWRCAGSTS